MLADYHHVLDMRRAPAELMIRHVEGEDHILLEGEGVFARHLRPHRNRVIGMFEADRMRRGADEARKASIVHGLERQVDDILEALSRPDRFIGALETPAARVLPA